MGSPLFLCLPNFEQNFALPFNCIVHILKYIIFYMHFFVFLYQKMGLVKTPRERTWKMATRQEGEIILAQRTPKTARGWMRNLLMLAKRVQGSHDVLTCGCWKRWKSALMLMVALRQ